jgi:hypothetical protein
MFVLKICKRTAPDNAVRPRLGDTIFDLVDRALNPDCEGDEVLRAASIFIREAA